MLLKGLQKTTLLDYPEKVACTVFTGGCNLRCPFCHNASLVHITDDAEIQEEEFFAFLKKRVNILDGVCITGGEPLLQKDIKEFIYKIKELGYAVKLDTNGFYPKKLSELLEGGLLDYVAMDIKNSKTEYAKTCGVDIDINKIEESIALLLSSKIDFEFRTTVVKELHSSNNIEEIAQWISSAPKYFLQCFKDSGDILSEGLTAYSDAEMKIILENTRRYLPATELRGIS